MTETSLAFAKGESLRFKMPTKEKNDELVRSFKFIVMGSEIGRKVRSTTPSIDKINQNRDQRDVEREVKSLKVT